MPIRTSLVGLAAAASMLIAVAPASAQVIQNAKAQNLGNPLSSTSTNMAVECAAVAPTAVGVGIIDCYLRGLHSGVRYDAGDNDALPGAVDAVVGARLSVRMEPYEVCMRTRVMDRNHTIYDTPLLCTPA